MVLWGGSGAIADSSCTAEQLRDGTCAVNADIDSDTVVIDGSTRTPGNPGYEGEPAGPGVSGPSAPVDPLDDCIYLLNERCLALGPGRNPDTAPPVQPITLADIAAFRPDAGVNAMEPNGWMVVGLDTNFYGSAGIQVHDGTLLGQPASVRFIPVAWHWNYGDGTSRSSTTAGAAWAALGAREFDPTATSHVYREPGTYVIDLTIEYSPEYRFGDGPWLRIAGTIPVPANRLTAVAGHADTVLVERECTIDPTGPGC